MTDTKLLGLLRAFNQLVGRLVRWAYWLTYKLIPIQQNTVLFISFHGRGYSDNPKAIYEYMKSSDTYKHCKFVWAIKHCRRRNISVPGAKTVGYFSFGYFYYMARSKYWIVNCKLPEYIRKKNEQIYLQTWHGTPLKRLGHDIKVPPGTRFYRSQMSYEKMIHSYDVDVARYDAMISPSSFTTQVFPNAFGIAKDKLIEVGYPRNDRLLTVEQTEIGEQKKRFGLPIDKKVILYAPTWRDNSFGIKGYTFELELDFELWQEVLGEEYLVLFKPHYLIVNDFGLEKYNGFVRLVESDKDIADCYLVSDVLVTDYSSAFFDYALLKKPIYFYMHDVVPYEKEQRGFYLNVYKDLPGDVFTEESVLLRSIRDGEFDLERLEEFNKRFNPYEDGQSSRRAIEKVFSA